MRPILFRVPYLGLPIYGYGLMLFLAFLGAMHLAAWRARREKLDPDTVFDLALWIFVGGLVGARGFYAAQYWGTKVQGIAEAFMFWKGGIVLYGSVLGGAAAIVLYWSLRRFPLRPMLDAIAPSLALGVAIGRIGCFLYGCCWGDRCDLPWAVRFPADTLPWIDHVHRGWVPAQSPYSAWVHPTQLYSVIDGLVLLALLSAYYPLRRRDGEVLALLMVTYPITRFFIEHLRSDEGTFFAGLTVSQNVSLGIFVAGLAFWAWLSSRPARRHADAEADGPRPGVALAETAPHPG